MFGGLFGQKFQENWRGNADKAGLADKLGVIGVGLSQLSAGQAPNILPAWQAVEDRRAKRKLGEAMANPELLAGFTPEQQKMLSVMPPEMAQSLIMEKMFAPPPDPMDAIALEKAQLELADMKTPDAPVVPMTAEEKAMWGLGEGTYVLDPETKRPAMIEGTEPPSLPADVQKYEYYRAQEEMAGRVPLSINEWDLQSKKAGAAQNTVTLGGNSSKFTEESDKAAASRFDGYVQDGWQAQQMTGDIQALAALAPDVVTGKIGDVVTTFGPYAEALGFDIEGLDANQAFKSTVDRMAPLMRKPGSGASSDFDAKQFLNSLPKLGNTPEGNAIIMQTLQAVQDTKMKAAEIAAQAQAGEMSWQEAEKKIRELPDPYEAFKKREKGNTDTSGGDTGGLSSDALRWMEE